MRAAVMKSSALLLTLLLLVTRLRSPEGAPMSARFDSDDGPRLDDIKPFAVALTPPSDALPPDVARLAAEGAAEAAAIRQEEAKTRQQQWRKTKQTAKKHRQGHTLTDTEQDVHGEDKKLEKGKKEKETRHRKAHRHGNDRPRDSSKVQQYIVTVL